MNKAMDCGFKWQSQGLNYQKYLFEPLQNNSFTLLVFLHPLFKLTDLKDPYSLK